MPTSIKLDAELKDRLGHLAKRRQRSAHWLMREAIREYVEHEENREALRRDAIQAWNDYQTAGQHLTLEEADAWLAKLEAGQEVTPPECHD
jgi:predicted transcriptional regulator